MTTSHYPSNTTWHFMWNMCLKALFLNYWSQVRIKFACLNIKWCINSHYTKKSKRRRRGNLPDFRRLLCEQLCIRMSLNGGVGRRQGWGNENITWARSHLCPGLTPLHRTLCLSSHILSILLCREPHTHINTFALCSWVHGQHFIIWQFDVIKIIMSFCCYSVCVCVCVCQCELKPVFMSSVY